jgi:hypothetical protein
MDDGASGEDLVTRTVGGAGRLVPGTHVPERRADAVTGSSVRRQTIQIFYTAGHC